MLERSKALIVALLLAACGGEDSAYTRALAALRAGRLDEAESAAAAGGPEIRVLCEFLRGNVAFARCEMVERQAEEPGAEPFAYDVAIAYGEKALRFWRHAAMSRADWPEARRNAERALLKLEVLQKKKADQDEQRRRESDPQPRPRPKPKPRPRGGDAEADPNRPQLQQLSREQVMRLLEKLAEKEREKLALRRSRRKVRMAEVERDW